ncbi:MAG: ABC transporter ATP-binding protein/permease [Beijerinckiaceae bacterium]
MLPGLPKMKLLSVIIAVFALLAAGVGFTKGDVQIDLLAAAALLCSFTTLRSQKVSTFLKIFIGIFGTELVLFGSLFLVSKTGFWPQGLADYPPPESLPVTVAIFGILVFAVSHVPVIGAMCRIADPYFESHNKVVARMRPLPGFAIGLGTLATCMVVGLVLINQAQVGINVRINYFSKDWFDAIQNKDQPEFWKQLLSVFLPWASIYVASAVIEYVMTSMFTLRWREFLSERYTASWLDRGTHYRLALTGNSTDNPDQRIQEDIDSFIYGKSNTGIYGYSILLVSTISTLVSFSILLWGLSANFTFPGTDIAVPGFLFWVALIYAGFGTLITHLIGRPLVKLFFNQQRFEADFRFSLSRLREYSEQIALLKGERTERSSVMRRFGAIYDNYLRIVDRRKKLTTFTASYGQISTFIPYIVAAPFYFAGKVTLGTMTQTASAFSRVEGALTFFITYYTSVADFKAVLNRLTSFDEAIRTAQKLGTVPPCIEAMKSVSSAIAMGNLVLNIPDGRAIMKVSTLSFQPGEAVLVSGPSGSGKSTMFRAISGIWPYGSGQISIPDGANVMLLPQRPYVPMGSLRDAVTYPGAVGAYADSDLVAALALARLPQLAEKLDADENWAQRLSGGEQQRLAIARALLAKPDWLFLDEATAALDETTEEAIYAMLARELPGTTIISIGHRSTLKAFHQRQIVLEAGDDGVFAPLGESSRERGLSSPPVAQRQS